MTARAPTSAGNVTAAAAATVGWRTAPGRGVRVRLDEKTVHAHDLLAGPLRQTPAEQCGDLLVRDRDGNWTYQFAVTVDDLRQGVTLVIRGADLLASTGRQVLLAEMLGRTTPLFFLHHPLIMGPSGEKLSKSARDTGVRELRAQGIGPEEVIGRAAAAIGLIASPRAIPPRTCLLFALTCLALTFDFSVVSLR